MPLTADAVNRDLSRESNVNNLAKKMLQIIIAVGLPSFPLLKIVE